MSTTIEDIISRGYWRLIVRPTRFNEVREESLVALDRIVREKSVRLRGWDFPHYDNEKATAPGRDFIEQEINWHHHKEKWRLYQSGQFILLRSLWEDWEDQALISSAAKSWVPGKELWVLSTIFTLAELCEFAARLAVTSVGDERMLVEATLRGMSDRRLVIRNLARGELEPPRVAKCDEYKITRSVTKDELLAGASDLALQMSRELFMRFMWDADMRILADMLKELRR